MSDDEFDEAAHSRLLKSISAGKVTKAVVRREAGKTNVDDLLGSIKTVKSSTDDAKKKVNIENKEAKRKRATKTLAPPLHRQERERIQGAVGYIELKKDLSVWKDLVEENRLADQLIFPLNDQSVGVIESAAERAAYFKPKTPMELEMAALLNSSKNVLKNDQMYTEAELEIMKAMDIKEARHKLAQMQKMRALQSYREAKFRYASKIKSKGYHRILKREKRRQLVKEFDELLVRDPEAAKEKLKELENQRIMERGSLKHRARNKFHQELLKHAGNDPKAKQLMDEHHRLGKELKSKVSLESESEDSDAEEDEATDKNSKLSDLIKSAALAASRAQDDDDDPSTVLNDDKKARLQLYEMRAEKRRKLAESRLKEDMTLPSKSSVPAPVFEMDDEWTTVTEDHPKDDIDVEQNESKVKPKKKKGKKRKLDVNVVMGEDKPTTIAEEPNVKSIDKLFDEAEDKLLESIKDEARRIRHDEAIESGKTENPKEKKKKKKKATTTEEKPVEKAVDISLDPRHFLRVETNNLSKVSADLVEKMDEFDEDQAQMVAEAFKDDDVLGDFEGEKAKIEDSEKPQDINLGLEGWGSWAGPGITHNQRKKRFIIKAKAKKRKDGDKMGLIIKESQVSKIADLQPRNLPFPYTRVEDYQTVIMQPIGKEWNPVNVTKELCKPAVVVKAGRSIRPLDKSEALSKKIYESESEED